MAAELLVANNQMYVREPFTSFNTFHHKLTWPQN